jgi:hypothetical protein
MFFGKKKDATESWKQQGKGEELRTHPRMGLKTIVTARARGREAHCKLHDLSLGGLAFIAPWSLDQNDPVSLTLDPPQGMPKAPKHSAFIDARVCRTIPSPKYPGSFQIGVKFLNPSPEAQEVIRCWFLSFGEMPEKTERRVR